MTKTILLVDDDVNLLSSMKRQFRKSFELQTATSGEEAVEAVKAAPPAVVVCDMRMGGMDGVQTLTKIKSIAPDTVRLMLTGNADMQTAIDAINTGHIFRFLTKPCPPEQMEAGLNAALEQYRLITAERVLLEQTLAGSVKVLIDMLAMASPIAFRRATRVRSWVRQAAQGIGFSQKWQMEIAAMLSPIGLLSVPPDVLVKQAAREPLDEVERKMIEESPAAGKAVIANIPRLANVAQTVYLQNRGYDGTGFPSDGPKGTDIPLEARVLKILNALAEVAQGRDPSRSDFEALDKTSAAFDMALMTRIRDILEVETDFASGDRPTVTLQTGLLLPDMVLAKDVVTVDGRLVLSALVTLSATHVESLRNLSRLRRIADAIQVFDDKAGTPGM
jgi:response regulator RpfG family c-di-GMP phosphodiesterase